MHVELKEVIGEYNEADECCIFLEISPRFLGGWEGHTNVSSHLTSCVYLGRLVALMSGLKALILRL